MPVLLPNQTQTAFTQLQPAPSRVSDSGVLFYGTGGRPLDAPASRLSPQPNADVVVDDTTGITDAGVARGVTATGTEPVGLTDSVTTLLFVQHLRTVDDPAGLTDTRAVVEAHARTQDDPAGITDQVVVASAFARTQADTAGLTDPVTPEVGRVVPDLVGLTDSASSVLAPTGPLTRTVDDPTGLVDPAAAVSAFGRIVDDNTGVTDAGVAQGRTATGTDSAGLTDSASAQLTGGGASLTRTVDDSTGITDLGAPQALDVAETVNDLVGLTDSAAAVSAFARSQTDTAGLTDTVSQQLAGSGTRQVDDTTGLTDAVTYSSTQTRVDSLGLVDTVTLVLAANRAATDTLGLTDTVTAALTRSVTVTDSAGLTDSVSAQLSLGNAYTRVITDPVGLTSNHKVVQTTHRISSGTTTRPVGTPARIGRPYSGSTPWHPFVDG